MIEAATANDLLKLLRSGKIKKSGSVELALKNKRKPRLIIYDVESTKERQALVEAVGQNGIKNKESEFNPVFRARPKNATTTHWVVETSLEARKVLLYRLKDYLVVTRCMKCMKYGHIAKHCKGDERCNKCGGSGHGKEECKETETCATCGPKSECIGKQVACEAYQQALRRLIEGTDYGD
ncbi:hypothetical protein J437_LFUL016635 [Ladona fulva]|uniref:CCHC-type domain-containing protein n=1 Tax=Ladona fulva TaxID=123851 RepID=A0A8K0KWS1_LADFU|nr:hypothetical protein J437_LFUL016635 [Ladona fulva]